MTGKVLSSACAVDPISSAVYIGVTNGTGNSLLASVDRSGVRRWITPVPNATESSPNPRANGLVYVGQYALNASSGAIVWAGNTSVVCSSTPVIGSFTGFVHFGCNDGFLYALDALTGQRQWSFWANASIVSTPAIMPDGTLIVLSTNKTLHAINGTNGSLVWKLQTYYTGTNPQRALAYGSPAIDASGTVFVGADGANLYAVNGSTGEVKWSVNVLGSGIYSSFLRTSPAIGPGGIVYVTVEEPPQNTFLRGINGATGEVLWSFNSQDGIPEAGASPNSPVLNADATVFLSVGVPTRNQLNAIVQCQIGTVFDAATKRCVACPLGTWQSKNSCLFCPQGAYCDQPAMSAVSFCPPGTYSSAIGANSSATCLPCPPGMGEASAGNAGPDYCGICVPGTYSVTSTIQVGGNTLTRTLCTPCQPGSFSPGQGRADRCVPCSPGCYNSQPGAVLCDGYCPEGTYLPFPGGTNETDCRPCLPGSYNPSIGASFCAYQCPAGYANPTPGAASQDACKACAPGFFSAPGSSNCTLCKAGTYSDVNASSACTACPIGTYLEHEGGTSANDCIPCPGTKSTAVSGATSVAQCLSLPFLCPSGYEPAVSTPLVLSDCVPLSCQPPLVPSPTNGSCVGCPAMHIGSPPHCTPCSANAICPGPLSLALGAVPDACIPVDDAAQAVIDVTPVSASAAVIGPAAVASIAGSCVIALFLWSQVHQRRSAAADTPVSDHVGLLERCFRTVDAFSMLHHVPDGASPVKRATSGGGMCTILGAVCVASFSLVLVLRRESDNVLEQRSLDVFDDNVLTATQNVPWRHPRKSAIDVHVLAQGEPGACSQPLRWSSSSLAAGNWSLQAQSRCSDSTTQHIAFSCAECVFSASSTLDLDLHPSCNSITLYFTARRPDNSASTLRRDFVTEPGKLLSTLSVQLAPLYSVRTDDVRGNVYRGYQFVPLTSSFALKTLDTDRLGNTIILPATSAVHISVGLSMQAYWASISLSEKQTVLQLVSSIIGLTSLFAIFGVAFQMWGKLGRLTCREASSAGKGGHVVASPSPLVKAKPSPANHKRIPVAHPSSDDCALTDNPLVIVAPTTGASPITVRKIRGSVAVFHDALAPPSSKASPAGADSKLHFHPLQR